MTMHPWERDNPKGDAMTLYRTIVVDPPWAYDEGWPQDSTSPNAKQPKGRHKEPQRRRALPYPAMTLHQMAKLPIPALAANSAHVLLWTTNRYIAQAYILADRWGFRPSQLLTWCKAPMGLGPGGVFASSTEFVLYARRGTPSSKTRQDSTWWLWPRSTHSTKPEAFLDMVEATFPGPYLEMFARRDRLGWDTWGNESLGTAELVA